MDIGHTLLSSTYMTVRFSHRQRKAALCHTVIHNLDNFGTENNSVVEGRCLQRHATWHQTRRYFSLKNTVSLASVQMQSEIVYSVESGVKRCFILKQLCIDECWR